MGDYGHHPTRFEGLSDDSLMAMYRSERWGVLGEEDRLALLQETVNRAAAANGEVGACKVEFADLGPTTAGVQSGNVIQLDRNRFAYDVVQQEYNGQMLTKPLFDSNVQALETVLHEDIHAWQNQCLDETIPCADAQLLAEYRANNFDISVIQKSDGTVDIGQQYLSGVSGNGGYYLYYLQSSERDAHRYSEMRTLHILSVLEEKCGKDPSFDLYRENISVNGFQATVEAANRYFGTDTVERDINTTLKNQYYHTNQPVNSPVVEAAVKQEMAASLQASMRNAQEQPAAVETVQTPDVPSGLENVQTGTETGNSNASALGPTADSGPENAGNGLDGGFGGIGEE